MSEYQNLTTHWNEGEPKQTAFKCAACGEKYDAGSVVNIDGHCICKECKSEYQEIKNYLNEQP